MRPGGRTLLQFNVNGLRLMATVHRLSVCAGAHPLATTILLLEHVQRYLPISVQVLMLSDRARACRLQARAAGMIEALTSSWVCVALSRVTDVVTRVFESLLRFAAMHATKYTAGGRHHEFQSTFSTRRSR